MLPIRIKPTSFLNLMDFTADELNALLQLAAKFKADKKAGCEQQYLQGKNVALIFEKDSTRTRCAFEVACADQGAHSTYLAPSSSQIGHKESMKDTARVLGRMYDGIEYRGFAQSNVETLAHYSGVPVFNGLTNEHHPTQVLADLLTMQEHSNKSLHDIAYTYVGDARYNMGNSLLIAGAILGMDVRIAAPKHYQPNPQLVEQCYQLQKQSGARITITDDVSKAVRNTDFIHTDVWVSMGEPDEVWQERIRELLPYRVDKKLMEISGNADVKFMHCLPAIHNRETEIGERLFQKFGLDGAEVSEEVFESSASIVFDQAENRMHTIKAVLVAFMTK